MGDAPNGAPPAEGRLGVVLVGVGVAAMIGLGVAFRLWPAAAVPPAPPTCRVLADHAAEVLTAPPAYPAVPEDVRERARSAIRLRFEPDCESGEVDAAARRCLLDAPDAAALGRCGLRGFRRRDMLGDNTDGALDVGPEALRVDPIADGAAQVVGVPDVRSLWARDGQIEGVGRWKGEKDVVFRVDPSTGALTELGRVDAEVFSAVPVDGALLIRSLSPRGWWLWTPDGGLGPVLSDAVDGATDGRRLVFAACPALDAWYPDCAIQQVPLRGGPTEVVVASTGSVQGIAALPDGRVAWLTRESVSFSAIHVRDPAGVVREALLPGRFYDLNGVDGALWTRSKGTIARIDIQTLAWTPAVSGLLYPQVQAHPRDAVVWGDSEEDDPAYRLGYGWFDEAGTPRRFRVPWASPTAAVRAFGALWWVQNSEEAAAEKARRASLWRMPLPDEPPASDPR